MQRATRVDEEENFVISLSRLSVSLQSLPSIPSNTLTRVRARERLAIYASRGFSVRCKDISIPRYDESVGNFRERTSISIATRTGEGDETVRVISVLAVRSRRVGAKSVGGFDPW